MTDSEGWRATGPAGGTPYGWASPPPVLQPGVIPLRPLALGDLLNGAMSTARRYWSVLLGFTLSVLGTLITAVLLLGVVIYAAVAQSGVMASFHSGASARPSGSQIAAFAIGLGVFLIALAAAVLLGFSALQAGCAVVVSEAVLGRPTTLRKTWRGVRAGIRPVIGVQLLTGLALALVALVVFAVPAFLLIAASRSAATFVAVLLLLFLAFSAWVYLQIRLSLGSAAAVFEQQSATAAIRRSWRLSAGTWWRLFGITMLAGFIASATAQAVEMPFGAVASGMLSSAGGGPQGPNNAVFIAGMVLILFISLLGTAITTPFTFIVTALLYLDLRIRREGLAFALAAAVGLPPCPQAPY